MEPMIPEFARFDRHRGTLTYEFVDEPRDLQPIGLLDVGKLRKRTSAYPEKSTSTTRSLTPLDSPLTPGGPPWGSTELNPSIPTSNQKLDPLVAMHAGG